MHRYYYIVDLSLFSFNKGSWERDPAEKMGEPRRPFEPDPGNTGGGKNVNKNKTVPRTRILAEISVFAALSAVLYVFRPFSLPYGGAVTLGSMIPVVALSFRRRVYAGVIAGALFGVLALFIDMMLLGAASIIATPLQAVLEYPVAFAALGLSGIFKKESVVSAIAGLSISVFIKFLIHYLVGVFIWSSVYSFPAEWGQYLWPAVYNGSFLIVEFIITAIVIVVLIKRGTLTYAL